MRLRVLRFRAIRNIEDKKRAAAKAPTFLPPQYLRGRKEEGSVQLYCIDEIGL